MKKIILSLLGLVLIFSLVMAVNADADTTAPLVTIESPEDGDIVSGFVDIYGTIVEETELSHYNISVYPGDADFNNFSLRMDQETVYRSSGFNNECIFQWDTTNSNPEYNYEDGWYLIRLAARDKAGNRDISQDPYAGGDDSQHVIRVFVQNTEIEVSIDIKPQSCPNPLNVKSQGVLPVAILGTDDFDVTNINPDTVTLEGQLALKSAIEDVATPYEPTDKTDCLDCITDGPDGYLDLILHFNTQDIINMLENQSLSQEDIELLEDVTTADINDGDCVILTLYGELSYGTPIKGEDSVLILKKGKQ
jgi:hypothetical protein